MSTEIGLVISTLLDGIFRVQHQLPFGWSQVVVVHQIPGADIQQYAQEHDRLKALGVDVIVQHFGGLSKSRNAGLKAVKTAYALIMDDDVQFPQDVVSRLQNSISQFPAADIYTYQIQTPEGIPFTHYAENPFMHNRRSIARVRSVELCVNMSWYKDSKVSFDEQFGLGATFKTGEEFIFLNDALHKQAKVQYVPVVVSIHPMESSGKLLDAAQLVNKGAMINRVYGWLSPIYMLGFALKKRKVYAQHASFFSALRYMQQGRLKYQSHG